MTVVEIQQLMKTRRLHYHFDVEYGVDPGGFDRYARRLVQVPRHCVECLLMGLSGDTRVCARLDGKDLVIG